MKDVKFERNLSQLNMIIFFDFFTSGIDLIATLIVWQLKQLYRVTSSLKTFFTLDRDSKREKIKRKFIRLKKKKLRNFIKKNKSFITNHTQYIAKH
jgi:hypothetical protein